MPSITINGQSYEFEKGQTILQVALENEIEIPHYCYHPGLSIVANCRICLAEVWAPNPRDDNKLQPIDKLLPTCQTQAGDGQVVYTDSPKAISSQKSVMEYLLINHPVDCPVCDQAGECHLQDYSYQYGRGQSRFQENKIKQPKKDLGPNVLLYSDRCIMCTRCVRFTREVTGTGELMIDGRGALEQIDVFPGRALDNELSANVIDICPVGALLDKDFLFQQRVWFLQKTPSIDGLTASGDNLTIEHNKGRVYRVKPRTNLDVNRYWITDEVRYGWKHVHDDERLVVPSVRTADAFDPTEASEAYDAACTAAAHRLRDANSVGLLVSPMLACEDTFALGVLARASDENATMGVGPIPIDGEDKVFADGFKLYAEKAPNARGVRRVLEKMTGNVHDAAGFEKAIRDGAAADVLIITGNYPSAWVTDGLLEAIGDRFVILLDILPNRLMERADVVLPAATWMEKAGTFENANNRLQTFEQAIAPIDYVKGEGQHAMDLLAEMRTDRTQVFNAANMRQQMATELGLTEFVADVHRPSGDHAVESDMTLVEI